MRDHPVLARLLGFIRFLARSSVGQYAACAGFFILLAFFPGFLLFLGLLRYLPLEPGWLETVFAVLPRAIHPAVSRALAQVWDTSTGLRVVFSAAAVLWSAGRGVYGLMAGLNRVCGCAEDRSYLRRRLLSIGITLPVAAAMAFLLLLSGCRGRLLGLGVLSLLFCLLYLALPARRSGWGDVWPGALLAAAACYVFSRGYAVYALRGGGLRDIYGSVYALALLLLWLQCCLCIFFYGAALNVFLKGKT